MNVVNHIHLRERGKSQACKLLVINHRGIIEVNMNRGLPLSYHFYIIRSIKTGKLYLGYTPDDPISRLQKHNQGLIKSTKAYIPYELICSISFKNEKDAIACEKYFKTTAGWKRLKRMLSNTLKH